MPADPAQQQPFFDTIEKALPGGSKLDWTVPQAMLGYPDIPNHQAWVPDYAKSQGPRWQAFRNKYRTTAGLDIDAELATLQDHPPGHLRRCPGQEPLAPPPPAASRAVPRPPGRPIHIADRAHRSHGADHDHDRDDRGTADHAARPPARRLATPASQSARRIWGYVFIGTLADRAGAVHRRPDDRLAGHVAARTSTSSSPTTTTVHRPRQLRPDGERPDGRRQSLVATFKFALIVIPLTMLASLGFALLLNHPKLLFKGPLRALVYLPVMIPLVARTLVWIGFLNTETGWLNQILGLARASPGPTGSTARRGSTRRCRSSACGRSATS